MYMKIGLEKCLPRQQDKCRERHEQAAINAPLRPYLLYLIHVIYFCKDSDCRGPMRSSGVLSSPKKASGLLRGPHGSSRILRGPQGSQSSQGSSGILMGPHRFSVVRSPQGSSEVLTGPQAGVFISPQGPSYRGPREFSWDLRGSHESSCMGSSGVHGDPQGSSGVLRGLHESSGVPSSPQGSSAPTFNLCYYTSQQQQGPDAGGLCTTLCPPNEFIFILFHLFIQFHCTCHKIKAMSFNNQSWGQEGVGRTQRGQGH